MVNETKSPGWDTGAEKRSHVNSNHYADVEQQQPSQLDRALAWAQAGYPVFPCRSQDEIDPQTGEVIAKAKKPLTPHGFKDATDNEGVIRAWWTRWPDALIGMPTGKRTGTVVVDVDCKNGKNGFASLAERGIALPDTLVNPTPSGGEHHIYRYPEGVEKVASRNDVLLGVDIKADGGFIILHGDIKPEDFQCC
jgi:putative DNA primase/helicase